MFNQEMMVVLADGKPVTVVRSRQSDVSIAAATASSQVSVARKCAAAADSKTTVLNRELRGKDFEEQIELKRLRTENRLLQQRVDNLEQVLNKRSDDQILDSNQLGSSASSSNANSNKCCDINYSSSKDDCHHFHREMAPAVSSNVQQRSSISETTETNRVTEVDSGDNELQRIQDELIACKLREAEANLSMKEFQQKVNQLERHWQQFLQENRGSHSVSGSKSDLKETVMALRLRETYLVCDLNILKQKLMELETQNHIYERQIKRQEVEEITLQEAIAAADLREKELLNRILHFERKLSDCETRSKEDAAMSRIRDAEHSQSLAEMRRRIAELEIENEQLMTAAALGNRYNDDGDLEVEPVTRSPSVTGRSIHADDVIVLQDDISGDVDRSLLLFESLGISSSQSDLQAV